MESENAPGRKEKSFVTTMNKGSHESFNGIISAVPAKKSTDYASSPKSCVVSPNAARTQNSSQEDAAASSTMDQLVARLNHCLLLLSSDDDELPQSSSNSMISPDLSQIDAIRSKTDSSSHANGSDSPAKIHSDRTQVNGSEHVRTIEFEPRIQAAKLDASGNAGPVDFDSSEEEDNVGKQEYEFYHQLCSAQAKKPTQQQSKASSSEQVNQFQSIGPSCPPPAEFLGSENELLMQQLAALTKKRLKLNSESEAEFEVQIVPYYGEEQLPDIMRLVSLSLSEPYTIYTYRYFLDNWPHLSFMAQQKDGSYVGTIVCKLDRNRQQLRRGYIAMLTVDEACKRQKIGSRLVKKAVSAMIDKGCDEVVLETEVTNEAALGLYENLGFVRDKRLFRYYLNGVDAFRLKLRLNAHIFLPSTLPPPLYA